MLEMKITVAAPELAVAINNLALALNAGVTKEGTAFIIPAGMEEAMGASKAEKPNTGAQAPVNPTHAPAQASGAPLNATTAQIATPIAPTAPAAAPAPAVAPVANVPSAVPTAAPTYTLDMIARSGTALVDAGKMDELCGLLSKYGVEALTALDPAQYGAFAADLRALGAQI